MKAELIEKIIKARTVAYIHTSKSLCDLDWQEVYDILSEVLAELSKQEVCKVCETCKNTGFVLSEYKCPHCKPTCQTCGGSGYIQEHDAESNAYDIPCDCQKPDNPKCTNCDGSGYVRDCDNCFHADSCLRIDCMKNPPKKSCCVCNKTEPIKPEPQKDDLKYLLCNLEQIRGRDVDVFAEAVAGQAKNVIQEQQQEIERLRKALMRIAESQLTYVATPLIDIAKQALEK